MPGATVLRIYAMVLTLVFLVLEVVAPPLSPASAEVVKDDPLVVGKLLR